MLQMQVKQSKKPIWYFPSAGRHSTTSRKAGLTMRKDFLGRQTPSRWTSSPSSFAPPLLFSTAPHDYTGHPFGQFGPAGLVLFPPSFFCSPSLLAGRAAGEAEKSLAQNECLLKSALDGCSSLEFGRGTSILVMRARSMKDLLSFKHHYVVEQIISGLEEFHIL